MTSLRRSFSSNAIVANVDAQDTPMLREAPKDNWSEKRKKQKGGFGTFTAHVRLFCSFALFGSAGLSSTIELDDDVVDVTSFSALDVV